MKRLVLAGLLVAVIGFSVPAGATVPKVTLVVGDSLTLESRAHIGTQAAARGWTAWTHAAGQTAPCDWIGWLAADLARYQPQIVTVMTAGNTGATPCMQAATGTDAYYAQYRADLATFFTEATRAGARVIFFAAPPFADPARNTAVQRLTTIARELAVSIPGVTVSGAVRAALSNNGRYTDTKPCAPSEVGLPGCVASRIPIRTMPGHLDAGLHLCPVGLVAGTFGVCSVYSSGERRYGRALANALR